MQHTILSLLMIFSVALGCAPPGEGGDQTGIQASFQTQDELFDWVRRNRSRDLSDMEEMQVSGTVSDLTALRNLNLDRIRHLKIVESSELRSLEGFEELRLIEDGYIFANQVLEEVAHLDAAVKIEEIYIHNNSALTAIRLLGQNTHVGYLDLRENPLLCTIDFGLGVIVDECGLADDGTVCEANPEFTCPTSTTEPPVEE